MVRSVTLILFCFFVSALSLFAFDGIWELDTQFIQVINDGGVLGFGSPTTERSVRTIEFLSDTEAKIDYAGNYYYATWKEESRYLILDFDREQPNLVLTLMPIGQDEFRYSLCLGSAQEELLSGAGRAGFVNYIGMFKKK